MTLADTIGNPDVKVVLATAHADIAKGKVVQIALATGLTSAPADNDVLGFFGVAVEDVASGEVGAFQIRGSCQAMTGDTSVNGQSLLLKMRSQMSPARPGAFPFPCILTWLLTTTQILPTFKHGLTVLTAAGTTQKSPTQTPSS